MACNLANFFSFCFLACFDPGSPNILISLVKVSISDLRESSVSSTVKSLLANFFITGSDASDSYIESVLSTAL